MDIASLQIKVNSNEVKTGDAALDKFSNTAKKAQGATQGLNQSLQDNKSAVRGLSGDIGGALTSAFGRLLSVYGAIRAINMIDEFTQLKGRIQQSTQSVQESAAVWAALLDISKKTGASMAGNVSIFQRLSFVRQEIHATTEEMLQFSETVSKLGVISGASQDAQKFGLTQLGQSLSSNIVRAEEFNSIMENIPNVGRAIAAELGVTQGELRQLVINGKLLSADVFAAILNSAEDANAQFEKMPMTVSRAWSSLLISLQESLTMLNEAGNLTNVLAWSMGFVADNVRVVASLFSMLGELISWVGTKLYLEFLKSFAQVKEGFASLMDTLSMGKIKIKATITAPDGSELTSDEIQSMIDVARGERNANLSKQLAAGGAAVQSIYGNAPEKAATPTGTRKIETDYKGMVAGLSANEEEKKAAEAIKKTIEGLKFKNEQMKRTNEEQELYNELRAAGTSLDTAAGKQIEELVRQHQALEKEQKATAALIDTMESGFKTLWKDAITGAGSWRDAMKSIVDDVSDMFYDLVIKDQLKGLLKGVLGGGGGGGNMIGSLLGSLGGGISSAAGSFFGGVKSFFGFANGGEFQVGGQGGTDSQLVAFRASPDETVSIRKPGQGAGGVGSVVYNIDARGADNGVEQRVKNAIQMLDRSIERRALNAVQNQFQRDPSYGRRG